jgi:phosphoglycerate dehydrogenase-like enzyme
MKLVVFPPIEESRVQALRDCGPQLTVVNATDEETAFEAIKVAEAFYGKITPRLLGGAKRLRWVQSPTASLEHYVFPELVEHTCVLTNMRGIYGDVVADHVWALILAIARNLPTYWRRQQDGVWQPVGGEVNAGQTFTIGASLQTAVDRSHIHLADQTLGIVGLGNIGQEIARRAAAFGCRVVAVDPRTDPRPPGVETIWPPEHVDRLLGAADFVVIAAPHTPRTRGWFGRERLRAMKPSAWLLNVGRGAIVPLDDLRDALHSGAIAGAALDVLETEPLPHDDPLWRMPNVIITPHVAACSPRIASRHLAALLENVRRFTRGEPLMNVVDKREWY